MDSTAFFTSRGTWIDRIAKLINEQIEYESRLLNGIFKINSIATTDKQCNLCF